MDRRANQTIRRNLHWKTTPMRPHLEKGDDGRGTGTLFLKKKKENKVRWRNALIFVKQSTRIVNCTKNTLKVPAKQTVQSIQKIKQDKVIDNDVKVLRSTTTRFTLELDGNIILRQVRLHPRSGSSAKIGSRIKVGIIGHLQPGLNSKTILSNSNNKHRWTRCRSDFDSLFSCSGSCFFRLPETFNSLANDGECQQRHLSHSIFFNMNRCAESVRTSHMMLHAHAWLKFKLCLHLLRNVPRSTSSSSFSSVPGLQTLLTSRNPCADPREHGGDGHTDPQPFTLTEWDGFRNMGCVWRYLEMVVPRPFRIHLTFLVNCRTGSVCKGFLPIFTILGNKFFFVVPDLSLRIFGVFWIFFFLMRRVFPLLWLNRRPFLEPWDAGAAACDVDAAVMSRCYLTICWSISLYHLSQRSEALSVWACARFLSMVALLYISHYHWSPKVAHRYTDPEPLTHP